MAKPRSDAPHVGDRVKLKGRKPTGKLVRVTPDRWCRVDWDPDSDAPLIVHLDELEKIDGVDRRKTPG